MTCKLNADTSDGLKLTSDTSGEIDLQIDASTKVHMASDGKLGIGTTSPSSKLTVQDFGNDAALYVGGGLKMDDGPGNPWYLGKGILGSTGSEFLIGNGSNELLRIDQSGFVGIGDVTTSSLQSSNTTDSQFYWQGNYGIFASYNDLSLILNRQGNDGTLVQFRQAGSSEGSISVSGSTVSYNGGHLSRWGRLPDGSQPTILKGTVMSNLDEMVVWSYDDVLYTEEDELPEGKSVGDVKTPAYTAKNEQRNQLKISDVEGDINVAGLFVKWDTEEDGYNDIDLAMTGDMVIRIAQGTTVQRGDLLMSAGDGTAKPQGDDIVRSKTIAKVTSTTVIRTYDDNSYVVPCVVMAC